MKICFHLIDYFLIQNGIWTKKKFHVLNIWLLNETEKGKKITFWERSIFVNERKTTKSILEKILYTIHLYCPVAHKKRTVFCFGVCSFDRFDFRGSQFELWDQVNCNINVPTRRTNFSPDLESAYNSDPPPSISNGTGHESFPFSLRYSFVLETIFRFSGERIFEFNIWFAFKTTQQPTITPLHVYRFTSNKCNWQTIFEQCHNQLMSSCWNIHNNNNNKKIWLKWNEKSKAKKMYLQNLLLVYRILT